MKRAILLAALVACTPAKSPERAVARGAALTLAQAIHAADLACSTIAKEKADAALADKCAQAYAVARSSVLAAADGVDAYDSAHAGQVTCAIAHGIEAADQMRAAIQSAGAKIPPVLVDALELGKAVHCGN